MCCAGRGARCFTNARFVFPARCSADHEMDSVGAATTERKEHIAGQRVGRFVSFFSVHSNFLHTLSHQPSIP